MCYASPVAPGPMGTNQGVERLVLAHALDDGVSGCLVVTALDVEVAQERLKDQGGQEGNPSLQQIDERGVGAELFEYRRGEASLKEPCMVILPWCEDHCAKAIVYTGVVTGLPSLGDGVRRPEALYVCCVVGIGVYDGEAPYLRFSENPHGLAVRDDVHQCIQGRLGGFVEDSLATARSGIDGFQGCPADLAKQAACEEVALPSHSPSEVWVQLIVVQACKDVLAHPLYSLGAWCEGDMLWFDGDVNALYLVCLGRGLSSGWLHPVAQCSIEILEGLESRRGVLGDFGAAIVIHIMHRGAQEEDSGH